MERLIIIIVAILTMSFAQVQPNEVSTHTKEEYKADATRLALRMGTKDATQEAERLYDVLLAIHTSDLKEANKVSRLHAIHTYPDVSVYHVQVQYAADATWAHELQLGGTETTNDTIQAIAEQYGLRIENHTLWNDSTYAFVMTANNPEVLTEAVVQLEAVNKITSATLLNAGGEGNDIVAERVATGYEITYSVLVTDEHNETARHSWTFLVDDANRVTFLRETGVDLPEWMAVVE